MRIHFKPDDGHVGDVVPFFWEGKYHAFYLKRREGRGTCYAHAVSDNMVDWNELPDALETGAPGEPDFGNCFTGSFIERNGVFHLFYTGHTPNNPPLPVETICHATSSDLVHWTKDAANPILQSDERWYERDDWRDPFLFWNEEEGLYWMLLTARAKDARSPRRGCIGVATSPDLATWEIRPPLWSPHIVGAPECADVFSAAGRWFALFSNVETRYRSFTEWGEPWLSPPVTDALDGTRFYAAKCFHAGARHLLAGWVSSNAEEKDSGRPEWGGTMGILRELIATEDGELHVQCPEEVRSLFTRVVLASDSAAPLTIDSGLWEQEKTIVGVSADGAALAFFADMPKDFRLSATVTVTGGAAVGGFIVRLSDSLEGGYQLLLEPGRRRAMLRNWERWGDNPPKVEHPLTFTEGEPIPLEIYVQDSILEAFFADRIALSGRIYDFKEGMLGLIVMNGQIRVENLTVTVLE